jgi:sec-independent protein translocase protein TatB
MFDIGWSELLVIAVVAIVVVGPKDLPKALRAVGQWTAKMKRMAREFQGQFNEALREAELDTIKRDVEALAKEPFADLNKQLDQTNTDIRQGLADAVKEPEKPIMAPETQAMLQSEPPQATPLMSPLAEPAPATVPVAEPAPAVTADPLPAPEGVKS